MEFFEERVKTCQSKKNVELFKFIASKHDLSNVMDESIKEMKAVISRFSAKLSEKWESSRRIRDRFLASNKAWLEGDITFRTLYDLAEPSTSSQLPPAGPGRPKILHLADATSKTKRRHVEDLVQFRSPSQFWS